MPTLGLATSRPGTPVDPELIRFPGTAFYRTMNQLQGIGPLLRDGQAGAFDAYRLVGQYGGRIVERLRSWHTGALGLYVT